MAGAGEAQAPVLGQRASSSSEAGRWEKDSYFGICVAKDTASGPPNLNERAWFLRFFVCAFYNLECVWFSLAAQPAGPPVPKLCKLARNERE